MACLVAQSRGLFLWDPPSQFMIFETPRDWVFPGAMVPFIPLPFLFDLIITLEIENEKMCAGYL